MHTFVPISLLQCNYLITSIIISEGCYNICTHIKQRPLLRATIQAEVFNHVNMLWRTQTNLKALGIISSMLQCQHLFNQHN